MIEFILKKKKKKYELDDLLINDLDWKKKKVAYSLP